MAKPYLLII